MLPATINNEATKLNAWLPEHLRKLRLILYFKTMSENIDQTGGVARKMINMKNATEVSYWVSKFGITREQLQTAVDRVGGKEARIADYLRAKGIIRF